MSREIKFRAWDKSDRIMINADSLAFEGYAPISLLFKDAQKTFEIMQYTGLHDKNGKEIYEGDIVVYKNTEERGLCKVTFEDCGFFARWIESETFTDYSTSFMHLQCEKELEVIGNIYENPELLSEVENENRCEYRHYEDLIEEVKNQPTAYDVDKVVEVLERYRVNKFLTIANTRNVELDKEYEIIGKTLDFVTEVIKKGSIDD